MRICMLSSVHLAYDPRIYQKEARTLARAGFDVVVIAREDSAGEPADGVRILSLSAAGSRLRRMLGTLQVGYMALRERADLYAFHDPELIPIGILLKLITGRRVVYDIHEIVHQQILTKEWLPRPLARAAATLYRVVERMALPLLDGLVLVVPGQVKYYPSYNTRTVRNFPLLTYAGMEADAAPAAPAATDRPTLVYTGSVRRIRGLYEMLELVDRLRRRLPDVLLRLVGPIVPEAEVGKVEQLIAARQMEANVELFGRVSHRQVHHHIARADVGLALIHPDPTYWDALFVKAFEYMMMGRPFVVSNTPQWEEITAETGSGLAVDPLDADAVEAAALQLLTDPGLRRDMGQRGREAVASKYNWDVEGEKLISFFRELTTPPL